MLVALWRWWRDSWREPKRARVLYAVLAAGFAAIAVAAAVMGDVAVAAVAAVAAVTTLGIAALAPRLIGWLRPPDSVR